MSMLLKLVHYKDYPQNEPDFCVYSGVTSCHFRRFEDGSGAEAVCYFGDEERHITFAGVAYLMNENGRTISTFDAQTSVRPSRPAGTMAEGLTMPQA